jgi:hypothetical protein
MAELSWGTKRTCQSCGTRFYDLRKTTPTCYKCGSVFEYTSYSSKGRRSSSKSAIKDIPVAVVTEDDLFLPESELDSKLDADLILEDDEKDYE